jgi:hypothetical protein
MKRSYPPKKGGKHLPPKTKKRRFIPLHASQPDGKPQPQWPKKRDRE